MRIEKKIERIIKISISELIADVESFFLNDYETILNFYNGLTDENVNFEFSVLNSLYDRVKTAINQINSSKHLFQDMRYWEVLLYLEELSLSLETATNTAKWEKASFNSSYGSTVEEKYALGDGQTLEEIAQSAGYDNPDLDWIKIVQRNQIKEENYTSKGDFSFFVQFDTRKTNSLTSVIDVIDNRIKLLGKDLPKRIVFENEDLKVLTEQETLIQTVSILSTLKKGDNPFRQLDGIDNGIIGGNRTSVQFPIIFRQLSNTFSTDDSFDLIKITGSEIKQDAIFLTFDVQTIIGGYKDFKVLI